MLTWLLARHPGGEGERRARPNAATDWPFPFPPPGRARATPPGAVPPGIAYRWPFRPVDALPLPSRGVPAPIGLAEFKRQVAEWCDDAGVISIDDPAIAHERDEDLYVYPHARSLVCMIGEENKTAMQSRYLPSANSELYRCEERLWEMGRRTVKYINALGGEGLTTTIGWPQEVGQRWADKIWPLSHKLVAQAAGLGVIGRSRNFLHRKFGAYCLIDTVVTNLEWPAYDAPVEWNPCLQCTCASPRARPRPSSRRATSTSSPVTTTPIATRSRASSTGSGTSRNPLATRCASAGPTRRLRRSGRRSRSRSSTAAFNCVSTCPAEIETAFHDDRQVRRRYVDETLKPLTP